jgi:hypothetical protein
MFLETGETFLKGNFLFCQIWEWRYRSVIPATPEVEEGGS